MFIAVVDDSKKEQQILIDAIFRWAKENNQIVNISVFSSGEEFIKVLSNKHFDIVFMDIYMKKMTGIETAVKLRDYYLDTLLIFITTSVDHMAEAFPCHTFDYLIKPIEISRLYKTLDRASMIIPDSLPYMEFVFEKQKISVLYSDLIYVLSDSNYCIVKTTDNKYRVRTSFGKLTTQFEDFSEFIIINRGVLVNLDNVIKIDTLNCIISDEEKLPVSRRKKEAVEQALLNRRFEKRRKGVL